MSHRSQSYGGAPVGGQGPPVVGSGPGEGHGGGNGERDRESGWSGGPREEIRPRVAASDAQPRGLDLLRSFLASVC